MQGPPENTSLRSGNHHAFYNNLLTSVRLGSALSVIGNNALNANYLTVVTIPAAVSAIGSNAFIANPELATEIFAGLSAPTGATTPFSTPGPTLYAFAGSIGFTPTWDGYPVRIISAAHSSLAITPNDSIIANGTSTAAVTATVRDETEAPVVGVAVGFTVPSALSSSAVGCSNTAGGTCSITLTGSFSLALRQAAQPSLARCGSPFSTTESSAKLLTTPACSLSPVQTRCPRWAPPLQRFSPVSRPSPWLASDAQTSPSPIPFGVSA